MLMSKTPVLITRLGAAPIEFVYGLRSKLGHGAHTSQIFAIFFAHFPSG